MTQPQDTPEAEWETIEVEEVSSISADILAGDVPAVKNIVWLIAMAKDHLEDGRPTFAAIYYDSPDTVKNATHEASR